MTRLPSKDFRVIPESGITLSIVEAGYCREVAHCQRFGCVGECFRHSGYDIIRLHAHC